VKFFKLYLMMVALGCASSAQAFANDKVLTDQSIETFYKDMIEARIAGGTYMISFHDKHFHGDLSLIISLIRTSNGRDIPKTFLDHDKTSFMTAIEDNDKVINRKTGASNVTNIVISEDGRSAVVDNQMTSSFVVQVDPLARPKNGNEDAQCQDKIVLSDNNMIQVVSSKCEVHVSMD